MPINKKDQQPQTGLTVYEPPKPPAVARTEITRALPTRATSNPPAEAADVRERRKEAWGPSTRPTFIPQPITMTPEEMQKAHDDLRTSLEASGMQVHPPGSKAAKEQAALFEKVRRQAARRAKAK